MALNSLLNRHRDVRSVQTPIDAARANIPDEPGAGEHTHLIHKDRGNGDVYSVRFALFSEKLPGRDDQFVVNENRNDVLFLRKFAYLDIAS